MNYLKELTPFVKTLCETSGEIIKKYYRSPGLSVESKGDFSPVTAADKGAETAIRQLIEQEFPEHGILGEEFGETKPDAEYKWVIDPIDGTKSFIAGTPLFGTLIALVHRGYPVLGAIHQPILSDFTIGDNSVAMWNGLQVKMRSCESLDKALALATDIRDIMKYHNAVAFHSLLEKVKYFRTWGDAYGYYLLATGQADIMLDPIMNPWDIMAVAPIIRGSGGVITDWKGNPPELGKSIVAASKALHKSVLNVLNS